MPRRFSGRKGKNPSGGPVLIYIERTPVWSLLVGSPTGGDTEVGASLQSGPKYPVFVPTSNNNPSLSASASASSHLSSRPALLAAFATPEQHCLANGRSSSRGLGEDLLSAKSPSRQPSTSSKLGALGTSPSSLEKASLLSRVLHKVCRFSSCPSVDLSHMPMMSTGMPSASSQSCTAEAKPELGSSRSGSRAWPLRGRQSEV